MRSLVSSHLGQAARVLDVRGDDADSRDYIYRPALIPLPDRIDRRRDVPVVLDQGPDGACVGFALAAVINLTVVDANASGRSRTRKRLTATERVSASMLYEMARRFDEWDGENYSGTSLRGAMKAWSRVGAASEHAWPVGARNRAWTDARASDARRRPLGAYYRIADGNPTDLQCALAEAGAIAVSLWVHDGWRQDQLVRRRGDALPHIQFRDSGRALHAVAIVGYTPDGLIVQNSWGRQWGTSGFALLPWEDWWANRQDAWVGRTAPQTNDEKGKPKLFVSSSTESKSSGRASSTLTEGLDIDPEMLPFLINTGDRGALDQTGRLNTSAAELPTMAAMVRRQAEKNGRRHVILYAHGGLDSESDGIEISSHLLKISRIAGVTSYSFVWETGFGESLAGMFRSSDDAKGPGTAGFSLADVLNAIGTAGAKIARKFQEEAGKLAAPLARAGWKEMEGRAAGASTAKGGAALFADALLASMRSDSGSPYVVHLVGHSAGSIYLGQLYDQVLRAAFAAEAGSTQRFSLGSIHLMAPAMSIAHFNQWFVPSGTLPVVRENCKVYTLTPANEDKDNIFVYPSSLLTYVADHLEDGGGRVPILGIRKDFAAAFKAGSGPTMVPAITRTEHHGQFDDPGHELDGIIVDIANGLYA